LIETNASKTKVEQFARDHRMRTVHYLQTRIAGSVAGGAAIEVLD
jgi:hypothetical protein